MRLCLDAVDGIDMNDTAGPWAAMIDVAHLITVYKGLMQALCEGIRGGNREPATVSEASERASVSRSALPPLPAPVARAEDPQRARSGQAACRRSGLRGSRSHTRSRSRSPGTGSAHRGAKGGR